MKKFLALAVLAWVIQPVSAATQTSAEQLARGKFIATAADCAGCHGVDFSGGLPVQSPLGVIYAANITPDKKTGIGDWSPAQFRDALRKGRSPTKGWLYPAMPYTSYTGMKDDDISALYAYLKSVPAVTHKVPATDLPFPFVRPAMIGWNLLYLKEGQAVGAKPVKDPQAQRGQYLVEALGHCTACHTPRGDLMGELSNRHLSGGFVGQWYAPNITPDPSGVGDWSNEQLAKLLKTGHNDIAVVAGDMGLAVSRSLSHLSDTDIDAMIAYLRQVPAVMTDPPLSVIGQWPSVTAKEVERPITGWVNLANNTTTDGAVLYQSACASCHGQSGRGAAGPALGELRDIRSIHPNNLVQVIAGGIDLKIDKRHIFMPGFADQMNPQQIAALATYVRTAFGQAPQELGTVTEEQVNEVLSGRGKVSWILANAELLAWGGILILALLVVWLYRWLFKRKHG